MHILVEKYTVCEAKHTDKNALLILIKLVRGFSSKQLTKVIWQKAASPTCHLSQMQMDSSDLGCYLIHGSLDPQESFRLKWHLECFSHNCTVLTHRQTDTQTTLRVTSVAISHIYDMHVMRPKRYSHSHSWTVGYRQPISQKPSNKLHLVSTRTTVTFQASLALAGTNLRCLMKIGINV